MAYPQCGIQFLDFANGDSLQLSGQAEILYDERTLPGGFISVIDLSCAAYISTKKLQTPDSSVL